MTRYIRLLSPSRAVYLFSTVPTNSLVLAALPKMVASITTTQTMIAKAMRSSINVKPLRIAVSPGFEGVTDTLGTPPLAGVQFQVQPLRRLHGVVREEQESMADVSPL